MEYIFIKWEGSELWYELNEDERGKFATRQINVESDGVHLSCFEDCLAEGYIDLAELDGEIIVTDKDSFEEKWQKETKKFIPKWVKNKKKYIIGSTFTGKVNYYYPQGTIVKNHEANAILYAKELFNVGENISKKVIGYDEINHWLIIE